MEKNLFILLTIFSTHLFSQVESCQFSYLVGSTKFPNYQLQTHNYDASNFKEVMKKPAPILQIYTLKKYGFVGGMLHNENGKKTKIKDITVISNDKNTTFTVVGEKFSREFELNNGVILSEENKYTTFYTKGIGIWKIYKK